MLSVEVGKYECRTGSVSLVHELVQKHCAVQLQPWSWAWVDAAAVESEKKLGLRAR